MQFLKFCLIFLVAPFATTVLGALTVTALTEKVVETTTPPSITMTYHRIRLPTVTPQMSMPYTFEQRTESGADGAQTTSLKRTQNEEAQRFLDVFNYGSYSTDYRIANIGEKVVKGIEIKPEDAEFVFLDGEMVNPNAVIVIDLPPKSGKSVVAIQRYPRNDWAATVGSDYFPAIEATEATRKSAEQKTEQNLLERNFVFSSAMAPFYFFVILVFTSATCIFGAYCHKRGWVVFDD